MLDIVIEAGASRSSRYSPCLQGTLGCVEYEINTPISGQCAKCYVRNIVHDAVGEQNRSQHLESQPLS